MNSAVHTLLTAISRWLLLVMLIVTTPTLLNAQSALTDDTQTSATTRNADKNFGSSPTLTVSSSVNSYLKFKLSSTIASGTTRADIAKATIKLYIGNITSPGKIDVYQVAGPWEEAALTFNSSPVAGTLLATTPLIDVDKKNEYVVIDVTQAVKDWLGDDGQGTNGAPNYGLLLAPHPIDADTPALANITFDSKENVQTSHEPELNIALTKPNALAINHDGTLSGDGTAASPLRVTNQSVGTAQLSDDAVTTAKLSDLVVTSEKISNDAVTNAKLADGSVTGAKIATPLVLTGNSTNPTLRVTNSGAGLAIYANAAIETTTQYNIRGQRILSYVGLNNLFAGVASGESNTTGVANSFFGDQAGRFNTTGFGNSFFGVSAGRLTTTGGVNSFFGFSAGENNTTGNSNSFFGHNTGYANNTGIGNSFFGAAAGAQNTVGGSNSFVGNAAGSANTYGSENSFFGIGAGVSNTSENGNTFIGAHSNGVPGITNSTAIGANARATQSNSVVLGNNASVGIGTTAPREKLHVSGGRLFIDTSNQGVILRSANGTCFELKVSDAGGLLVAAIACP